MPSPDVRDYVDLTLLDVTADDLAAAALAILAGRLPGWVQREAATEVMLIEANAAITAELVNAINRMPGAVLETLLRLVPGVERSTGTPAVGDITVTVADALGTTIPAGYRFRTAVNDEPIELVLDEDLVIGSGSTTGSGAVTAAAVGVLANGVAAGTALLPLDAGPVLRAELATDLAGGTDPEDGATFLDRASARLGRLTSTLVLPQHFTDRALEEPGVYRATTLNLYDADTDTPDTPGHVTVAVAGPAGAELTSGELIDIADALAAEALASLTLHIINATITAVDIYAEVAVAPGNDAGVVTAGVEAALTAYLDPDAWAWAATVRRNELIAIVDGVDGVDYVVELYDTALDPFADLVLGGPANLVTAGDITASTEPPTP
jgi:uncharacterized phage protein gp47/JayE